MEYKITEEAILEATEGGKSIILYFYPKSEAGFERRRNFSIRDDDKNPSCTVFFKSGKWFFQDKGGSDTKAYTAIGLIKKEMNMSFLQALEWAAAQWAPRLLSGDSPAAAAKPSPSIEEAAPQDEITVHPREDGSFTEYELKLLGYRITPEVCESMCLVPLDYYITRKNEKGISYKISSKADYPIYYYDYGSFGKIYQPLGELRFLWVGQKPEDLISGDREFLDMWAKADNSPGNPFLIEKDPEDSESVTQDLQWKELIICSGPSDALNVHRAGYHVCWLNSETAELSDRQHDILCKIAKKLYILYDIDDTGLRRMYEIAKKFLDINIITLPEDLKLRRDRNGKPCKDAKDFFTRYRTLQGSSDSRSYQDSPDRIFSGLVSLAGSLRFWQEKRDKRGNLLGYDINNTQLYSFLQALGYFTIPGWGKSPVQYCRIIDNVVTLIPKDIIRRSCVEALQTYLVGHPQYYRQGLANAIYRSEQLNDLSMQNLKRIEPNFDGHSRSKDVFFFRNCMVSVTAEGITTLPLKDAPCMVYSDKILDTNFTKEEPYFRVSHTKYFLDQKARLASTSPTSPGYKALKRQVDAIEDVKKYHLEILRGNFDWLQYIYNTGRTYWQKEEAGFPLSQDEIQEHDLNFISKVAMLGYLLSKHKDASKPYGVYAMEEEQAAEGEHRGGTGKSILLGSIEKLRNQEWIDGQQVRSDKMEFILQKVKKGYTDNIFIDDLNSRIDLHRFMNWITGKMETNAKYADKETLSFAESPKVAFSSNHAIKDFDGSMKRRTWFAAFSNYYHSEGSGLPHRDPFTEFGRTLIEDYGPEDMNHFYNFMFNCISVWHMYKQRIQPSMRRIMQRNLKKAMTEEFLWWAQDYFTEDRLNTLLDKNAVFEEYRATLPKAMADMIKPQTFKTRLQLFCEYNDWVFNPDELLRSESERARNDIRKKTAGEDHYYFYIQTDKEQKVPVELLLGTDDLPNPDAGKAPLFESVE